MATGEKNTELGVKALDDLFTNRYRVTINGTVIQSRDKFVCPQCGEALLRNMREYIEAGVSKYISSHDIKEKPLIHIRAKCPGCDLRLDIGIICLPEPQPSASQEEK
jgi:hypothetical protein